MNKSKESRYIPDNIYYMLYFISYRHFWGYYTIMHGRVYSPGYYTIDTRYFSESHLYDLNAKELIYSVQTESFDLPSTETLAHEQGKPIINDIVKKGFNREGIMGKAFQ
ncbi:MAG TPA: hypothetical protein VMT76_02215 [Puia sp.]|nr:hypothetical protein [Puia sp.]